MTSTKAHEVPVQELDRVTIRFAGDSGDGMQLTGTQFTRTAAVFGNDISTLPDYPAEIRAPAGSVPGVSGFQISLQLQRDPHPRRCSRRPRRDEPGRAQGQHPRPRTRRRDHRQQRRVHASEPRQGGLRDQPPRGRFAARLHRLRDPRLHAQRAGARWPRHDLEAGGPDQELLRPRRHVLALRPDHGDDPAPGSRRSSAGARSSRRPTGGRSTPATPSARRPRSSTRPIASRPAHLAPGTYRNITGNEATALGLLTASKLADRPLVYASYPITPASEILH